MTALKKHAAHYGSISHRRPPQVLQRLSAIVHEARRDEVRHFAKVILNEIKGELQRRWLERPFPHYYSFVFALEWTMLFKIEKVGLPVAPPPPRANLV